MACAAICKLLMIILNLCFMLFSLVFLAVGVILVFLIDLILDSAFEAAEKAAATEGYTIVGEASDIKEFPLLYEIGVALLVFGAILFFLSMIGCCGSCCSSCCRMLLIVFVVVMFIVVVAEITVFSLFLVKDSSLHEELKKQVQDKISSDYDEINGNTFTSAIIVLNREADCCGMEGVADFGIKSHLSCEAAYEQVGCYDEMQERIQDNKLYAGLVVAALLALQAVQMICAIVIFKDEKSKISPI